MKRIARKLSKLALCLAVLATSLVAAPALAQIVVIAPPPTYIATARPVYHGGRAVYWYNGRWVYRHGHAWHTYRTVPVYLRNHHYARVAPVRHVYHRNYYHRGHRR
jgi:hypothetical protein